MGLIPAERFDHRCPSCGYSAVLWEPDRGAVCLLCSRVREEPKRRPSLLSLEDLERYLAAAST